MSSAQRRLRVGIDAHTIDGMHQGTRTHTIELNSRIAQLAPEIDFFFFLDQTQELLKASPVFSAPNVTAVRMPHKSPPIRLLSQLPGLARQSKLDLLHCQYIVPPVCPCPTAVTIHDTLFESNPEFYSKFFVLRSRLLMRRSARKSALVFSVSDFSRRELIKAYQLHSERVSTVPNGVDCARFHPRHEPAPELEAFGLAGGAYLLTVGRLDTRKNHINLLRAFELLPKPRPKLVIIGQRDFGYAAILAMIGADHLKDEVVLLENINDDLLPVFYRNAAMLVYPSRAEGFGMPILEAMASGIPVVTSKNTALQEVGGDAVLYADPESPELIAAAISGVLNDARLGADLVRRGMQRAAEYNWEDSAARVVSHYREFGASRFAGSA